MVQLAPEISTHPRYKYVIKIIVHYYVNVPFKNKILYQSKNLIEGKQIQWLYKLLHASIITGG